MKGLTYKQAERVEDGAQVRAVCDLHLAKGRVVPEGTEGIVQSRQYQPAAGTVEFHVNWNVNGEIYALKVQHGQINLASAIDCEVSREV
jgi:hypothetical protein